MSSIFNGQIGKNTSDKRKSEYQRFNDDAIRSRQNYKAHYKTKDISKIAKDIVPLTTGGTIEIHPAEIAQDVKIMMDDMMRDSRYAFIVPFIKKPVIWTYEIGSALTDGIRVYMSPLFAHTLINGIAIKEANKFASTLSEIDLRDTKNRRQYRSLKMKLVRFAIIHEIYHIIYNHVRRGILKFGSNPTKQEHYVGNVSMDLEINRDIESTFPDLAGSTEAIGGVWYLHDEFQGIPIYNKNKKPFMKDIWEDIWDVLMSRNANFNLADQFSNEGANPVQQDNNQVGPYADGWRKAVDAIKGKLIDPKTINIPGGSGTISQEDLADILDKIINAAANED